MNHALYSCILFALLSACSTTPVSEQIGLKAKSDLKAVESILSDVKSSIPNECQNTLENDLNQVFVRFKEIDSQIQASMDACKVEKESLESQVTNRNLIIGLLCLAIAGLILIKIKT